MTTPSLSIKWRKYLFIILLSSILLTWLSLLSIQKPDTSLVDYNQLMDIPFEFFHLPSRCSIQNKFVILVHTSPNNFARRKTIRETWAKDSNEVNIFFTIGEIEKEPVNKQVQEEIETHKDFIQGSFLDTYHNLTYKHVMNLKYFMYHCPSVKYLVKIDDDAFVNLPALKTFLDLYSTSNKNSRNILCQKREGHPVLRVGKWKVSETEIPEKTYPVHCLGFAVIYPREAVSLLYLHAQKLPYFWIDDVFVSGIAARAANVQHTNANQLILSKEDLHKIVDLKFTNVTKPFLFGSVNTYEPQIRALWAYVKANPTKNCILEYLS